MEEGKKPDWERFGRARKTEAAVITELNSWRKNPRSFDVASYYCQVLIHRAHTVMLAEQGIIRGEEAKAIIKGVKEVEEAAKSDQSLVGYMSTETALIKIVGDVGGRMHIGRSRNDLGHTQRRMFFRDQVERVIGSLIAFQGMLLEKAESNLETIMPGYTHWRQAQPVTLAHYILAHVDASDRSIRRLEEAYNRTNISPMGSAALAGTSWPVNRRRCAELLGFDGVIENSQDAVATIDYVVDLASAIAIHMSNLSRLSEDLQIWSSDEFGLIDLDEAYAGTSSIMPQKKNPLILETVKAHSAESLGNLVSVLASLKSVSYTNTSDKVLLEPVAIDTTVGSTNVMAGLVSTMVPKKDTMIKNLREGFSTTTDLADALVRIHGLSFRQAHDIVVDVILKALERGIKTENILPSLVSEASQKVIGRSLTLSEEELKSAIDPRLSLERRGTPGSPAPKQVKYMLKRRKAQVKRNKDRHNDRISRLRKAYSELENAEKLLR